MTPACRSLTRCIDHCCYVHATTADGHTYERYAIEEWFRRGHRTSPLTGLGLSSTTLVSNITLRNVIEEWRVRTALAKSPRTSSPGEEKRRALHEALDMREVRLAEMQVDHPCPPRGEKALRPDACLSACLVLA